MSSILKHWRESATLLLVAKTRIPSVTKVQTTNYEILMLKRSGKSKFMPKLHVFPGGMSHDADFSPKWMELFSQTGNDAVSNLNTFLKRGGKGTPMFSRTRPEEFSKIPSELAFRICAIRETFEESGILLVRDIETVKRFKFDESVQPLSGRSSILSDSILLSWRKQVDNDAWQFLTMCEELKVVPDVWSLYEWSNWLTPIIPGKQQSHGGSERTSGRRYDTAFYLCVLDYIPDAVHDNKETTELEWSSASMFLEKHMDQTSKLQLAPPQIVELGRLLNFTDVNKLKQFSWERSAVRVTHCFPVTCLCDDGALIIYPGDDLYPEKPDLEGERPPMFVTGTREELHRKSTNINRSEIYVDENNRQIRDFKCNVKMSDGQVSPLYNMGNTLPRASL